MVSSASRRRRHFDRIITRLPRLWTKTNGGLQHDNCQLALERSRSQPLGVDILVYEPESGMDALKNIGNEWKHYEWVYSVTCTKTTTTISLV